jgi:hypothetical protein
MVAVATACALVSYDVSAEEPVPVTLAPPAPPAWPIVPRWIAPPTTPAESLELYEAEEHETRVLPWGQPAPVGYHSEWRPRSGLTMAGTWMLVGAYSLAATVATACALVKCSGSESGAELLIPALGPFVIMARTENVPGNVVLAMDGLAQLGGVAMITAGYVFRREVFVVDAAPPHVTIAPLLGTGQRGIGVVGVF